MPHPHALLPLRSPKPGCRCHDQSLNRPPWQARAGLHEANGPRKSATLAPEPFEHPTARMPPAVIYPGGFSIPNHTERTHRRQKKGEMSQQTTTGLLW